MSDVVKKYADCFRQCLETKGAYHRMVASLTGRQNMALQAVARKIGESDEDLDEATAKAAFIEFLKSDGDASAQVTRNHSRSLAAFDKIGTPAALELKEAGRRMLEAEFAVWHAHKQLLGAMLTDSGLVKELDNCSAMRQLISSRAGFNLHEELAFCEIWTEIYSPVV